MTSNGTRALCGEHGLPLFYAAGSVMCEHEQHPCNLSWSDLQPEAGEKIETREGAEIFASEVWVIEEPAVTIWTLLEQDAPKGCEAVQDLYSWSLNYESGKGPFALLLDLIGWSEEEYGSNLYLGDALGYVECDKVGRALQEYATRPADVREYVARLLEAESADTA